MRSSLDINKRLEEERLKKLQRDGVNLSEFKLPRREPRSSFVKSQVEHKPLGLYDFQFSLGFSLPSNLSIPPIAIRPIERPPAPQVPERPRDKSFDEIKRFLNKENDGDRQEQYSRPGL